MYVLLYKALPFIVIHAVAISKREPTECHSQRDENNPTYSPRLKVWKLLCDRSEKLQKLCCETKKTSVTYRPKRKIGSRPKKPQYKRRFAYSQTIRGTPKLWRSNTVKLCPLSTYTIIHWQHSNIQLKHSNLHLQHSCQVFKKHSQHSNIHSKHSINQVKHSKQACKIYLQHLDIHFKRAFIQFLLLFRTFDFQFDIEFKHSIIQLHHSM